MRKILLVAALIGLMKNAQAQPDVTLLTFGGYTFPDRFQAPFGSGRIEDGFQWGGGFEFGLSETNAVELIYQNLATTARYTERALTFQDEVVFHYIMLGGTRYAPISDVVSGFGTLNAGMAIIEPGPDLGPSNITRFAIGGRLGLRFMASDKLSLRIHTQVMSPVQWASGGFFFGTGGGGAGVSTGSTVWQFNLGGSLNIRLK